ncbi:MAG: spore maturation protein A [Clostridiales bacterium]|nr:spore maturation protein A [Clostridiales bacterium]
MVMSWIWTILALACAALSVWNGNAQAVSEAALTGASTGVQLALSLAGPLCLWSGLAHVMEQAGLTEKLAVLLRPLLARLFPQSAKDPATLGHIAANMTANLLGLGNAATPLGIAAVKRMARHAPPGAASDEMCRLIVMNTASIQLIPTTVATVRLANGCATPFDILPAVWVTSLCSVTAGLLAATLLQGRFRP